MNNEMVIVIVNGKPHHITATKKKTAPELAILLLEKVIKDKGNE